MVFMTEETALNFDDTILKHQLRLLDNFTITSTNYRKVISKKQLLKQIKRNNYYIAKCYYQNPKSRFFKLKIIYEKRKRKRSLTRI